MRCKVLDGSNQAAGAPPESALSVFVLAELRSWSRKCDLSKSKHCVIMTEIKW